MMTKGWKQESTRHALARKGIKTTQKKQPLNKILEITRKGYWNIGYRTGLEGQILKNYVDFMQKRFPNERSEIYATEWATRFKLGTEWSLADKETKRTLQKIDKKYGRGKK